MDPELNSLQWFFRAAISFLVWIDLALCLIFLAHYLLTLPMRRSERARLFLEIIEAAINQGRPVEETLISVSHSGDLSLGVRFHLVAAWLERNFSLSDALAKEPRFLPPQVTAILMAGQKIGDLRKVLPACRHFAERRRFANSRRIELPLYLDLCHHPVGAVCMQLHVCEVHPPVHGTRRLIW